MVHMENTMAEKRRHRWGYRGMEGKPHVAIRERRRIAELDFQHDAETLPRKASVQEEERNWRQLLDEAKTVLEQVQRRDVR